MNAAVSAALFALTVTVGAQAQTLDVNLQGVTHDRGTLRVALYADPKTFRKENQAFAASEIPAAKGLQSVRFEGVPPGTYAVLAYHDEDGNGELNRRLGMFPTEGYGLSNNPKVMGPPAFIDSAFEVTVGAPAAIDVEMRY